MRPVQACSARVPHACDGEAEGCSFVARCQVLPQTPPFSFALLLIHRLHNHQLRLTFSNDYNLLARLTTAGLAIHSACTSLATAYPFPLSPFLSPLLKPTRSGLTTAAARSSPYHPVAFSAPSSFHTHLLNTERNTPLHSPKRQTQVRTRCCPIYSLSPAANLSASFSLLPSFISSCFSCFFSPTSQPCTFLLLLLIPPLLFRRETKPKCCASPPVSRCVPLSRYPLSSPFTAANVLVTS